MPENNGHKLFWFTLMTLSLVSGLAFFTAERHLPQQHEVDFNGQPTIGYSGSKVHVVIFEEPKCPHCKKFTLQVFPRLKEKYIDTHQITFTTIPVAFLPGSINAATALVSIYLQDMNHPNAPLFYTFLEYMYKTEKEETADWATPSELQKMAKAASPAINVAKLKRSIDNEELRALVEKNTQYGTKLMGHLVTPTLYVNGMKADDITYETVSHLIDAALSQTKEQNP